MAGPSGFSQSMVRMKVIRSCGIAALHPPQRCLRAGDVVGIDMRHQRVNLSLGQQPVRGVTGYHHDVDAARRNASGQRVAAHQEICVRSLELRCKGEHSQVLPNRSLAGHAPAAPLK